MYLYLWGHESSDLDDYAICWIPTKYFQAYTAPNKSELTGVQSMLNFTIVIIYIQIYTPTHLARRRIVI